MTEVSTAFRIDTDIIRRYKIAAANRRVSMAELVRKALDKGIKELEKQNANT
jgi:predicted HicB family RNase H-like nuclease